MAALLNNVVAIAGNILGASKVSTRPGSANVIDSDDPSIFDQLRTLHTSNPTAYNAIVRPNNPPPGIGGFLFDIPGDEEVRLKSQISRHFVESNIPVSDHIALEPEVVTVRGLVAELVAANPTAQLQAAVVNPLQILAVLLPPMTPAQIVAQALATQLTAQTTRALSGQQSLYQYFLATAPNVANLGRQQRAFLYFQQAWWGRQIMSVETPWGIYTNMAISDVRALQPKESKYISDFVVIFERIRVVGDITVQTGNLAGRNALQQAPVTQNGNAGLATPTTQQEQKLYNLFGK